MRRAGIMLTVGLLSFLFGCHATSEPYVSQSQFEENLTTQTALASETLKRLRDLGVTDNSRLKLEYFFYSNSPQRAAALAGALRRKAYSSNYSLSPHDQKTYLVTGWTDRMPMDEATVVAWTRQMCQIGYENDCEFDGWGTYPDQE